MEKQHAIALSLNDLVFENRNKRYGAYQLRQSYENHLRRAAFIGTGFFVAVFLLLSHLFGYVPETDLFKEITDGKIKLEEVILTPIQTPQPPLSEPPKIKVATADVREMEVVKADQAMPIEKLTRVDDIGEREISGENQEGGPAAFDLFVDPNAKTGVGNGLLTPEPAAETIFLTAEQMPAFPGGDAALARFLSRNLRFPASAQRNDVSGLVYVSFVISRDGAVTDVKILKGVEEACDAEAVRVVGKMPNWNPGRQNGRSVSVRYSIPIRFAVQ